MNRFSSIRLATCIAAASALLVTTTAFAARTPPPPPPLRVLDSTGKQVGANLAIVLIPDVDSDRSHTIILSVVLTGGGLPAPTIVEVGPQGFLAPNPQDPWFYKDDACAGDTFLETRRIHAAKAPLVEQPAGADQTDFLFVPTTGTAYAGPLFAWTDTPTGPACVAMSRLNPDGTYRTITLANDYLRVPKSNFGTPPFLLAP